MRFAHKPGQGRDARATGVMKPLPWLWFAFTSTPWLGCSGSVLRYDQASPQDGPAVDAGIDVADDGIADGAAADTGIDRAADPTPWFC